MDEGRDSSFPDRGSRLSRGSLGQMPVGAPQNVKRFGHRLRLPRLLAGLLVAFVIAMYVGVFELDYTSSPTASNWLFERAERLSEWLSGNSSTSSLPAESNANRGSQSAEVESDDWSSYLNDALAYAKNGELEQAEVNFLNALFRAERLGDGDSRLTNVLDNFGYFYAQNDRYDEALPLYIRALAGYHEQVGTAHEYFISLERRIAYIHQARGEYDKALVHLYAAIDGAFALHGEHYEGVAHGYKETAELHEANGDLRLARTDYKKSLAVGLEPDHPLVIEVRTALAKL